VLISVPPEAVLGFKGVTIWWHREVRPAPGTATFNEVPTSHPQFQFIEALVESGITAGCGGGNYCPGSPLTRGQMAVLLAKALGLYWPF
jgi:S-layer homology domain